MNATVGPFANGTNQAQFTGSLGNQQKAMEQKRRMGQRELILDFFEKFHDNHEILKELTTFTKDEFF